MTSSTTRIRSEVTGATSFIGGALNNSSQSAKDRHLLTEKNNPQPQQAGNHNHPARIANVEVLKAESDLMKRAQENPESYWVMCQTLWQKKI